jgi:hypothetical protein
MPRPRRMTQDWPDGSSSGICCYFSAGERSGRSLQSQLTGGGQRYVRKVVAFISTRPERREKAPLSLSCDPCDLAGINFGSIVGRKFDARGQI